MKRRNFTFGDSATGPSVLDGIAIAYKRIREIVNNSVVKPGDKTAALKRENV